MLHNSTFLLTAAQLNALHLGHLNFKVGIHSVLIKLLFNKLLRPKYLRVSLIVCLLAYHTTAQHTPDYPSKDNPGCILSTMYFFIYIFLIVDTLE